MSAAPDSLSQLLAGRWRDPDDGTIVPPPLRAAVIAPDVAHHAESLVSSLSLGGSCLIVADHNTHPLLGRHIADSLGGDYKVTTRLLPPAEGQGPDIDQVSLVRETFADGADFAIAVGSGSINDTVKRASFEAGKPYVVFGTAPSMNGYVSGNATILTKDGRKHSLPARPPVAVFLDLAILCAAPARLIRAGLGDSLCRGTCQADWLLSHFLRGTPYRTAPFLMLQDDETLLLRDTGALLHGDMQAMTRLARLLILGGIGMSLCGGSYPASQGEHLMAHYLDITAGPNDPALYHGEAVGVATLTLRRLQEEILSMTPVIAPLPENPADIEAHFGAERAVDYIAALRDKNLTESVTSAQVNDRLQQHWPEWRHRIRDILPPPGRLEKALHDIGAPTSFHALGLSASRYRDAIIRARQIRDRYGFLDLAATCGILDRFAAQETVDQEP